MSARTETQSPRMKGAAQKNQLARLRAKHPKVAAMLDAEDAGKTLPLKRESPFVDAAFSSRHSEVHICTGQPDDEVSASVDLTITDGGSKKTRNFPEVLVGWTMERHKLANGEYDIIEVHPLPHAEMSWRNDEIEAFATALYQAVQLAKKQGYLPQATGGNQS